MKRRASNFRYSRTIANSNRPIVAGLYADLIELRLDRMLAGQALLDVKRSAFET